MAASARGPVGARITRTGIALVHEGELVLPAAGSEAEGEQVLEDARATVEYVFPVEIEIRGQGVAIDVEAIVATTLERLQRALGGR